MSQHGKDLLFTSMLGGGGLLLSITGMWWAFARIINLFPGKNGAPA